MEIISILAIVIATLALIPYCLEIWLWYCKKPKLQVTILSKESTVDESTGEFDIRFWLYVKLKRGYPAYVKDLQLIIPLEAKPYRHPDSNESFQQRAFLEGPGMRQALVLGASPHPLSSQYTQVHLVAFRVPKEFFTTNLDIYAAMEIDEAKLGFWAIFYHTRRYFNTLTIELSEEEVPNMSDQDSPLERTWESTLYYIISAILYPTLGIGTLAYFILYIKSLVTQVPVASPLDLAGVAGAIGGLILVGAFYKEKGSSQEELAIGKKLKRIAKYFLEAAVSFTIAFLLLQAVSLINSETLSWGEWILVYLTSISMAVAGVALCLALTFLIRVIRYL